MINVIPWLVSVDRASTSMRSLHKETWKKSVKVSCLSIRNATRPDKAMNRCTVNRGVGHFLHRV